MMKISRNKIVYSGIAGIFLGMLGLISFRYAFFFDGDFSPDAYYHVRIALEGWKVFAAKTFPHLILSSWNECFADKELLFHWILGGIQSLCLALGFPEFPFHVPNAFFVLILLIAFAWAGIRYRIRILWFLIPFLVVGFPYFSPRLVMIRPHLLAIALMLFSAILFSDIRTFKESWKGILIAFLFVWSYSNPHFVYLPAGAFALAYFLNGKRSRAFLILLSVTTGLLMGFLIHPQVPNTFINWKIQCIDVPLFMLQENPPLLLGQEMVLRPYRLFGNYFLLFLPYFLLIAYNVGMTVFWLRRDRRNCFLHEKEMALLFMAGITALAYIFIYRMVEYAWPFNVLYAGVLTSRFAYRRFAEKRALLSVLSLALLLSICSFWTTFCMNSFYFQPIKPCTQLASWFQKYGKSVPKGLVIANLNWSDFPQLYYAMPQFRYLCGLDPTFGYFYKKDITLQLEKIYSAFEIPKPAEMMNLVGTPLIYVSERDSNLAKELYNSGYRMIYQGVDGWLFSTFGSVKK